MCSKLLTIAVDFDGTLCEHDFPRIGPQTSQQIQLMSILIELRAQGHKLILWTNRGDNEAYPVLTEAIEWCRIRGLDFDAVNENVKDQKKLSGYSPKVMADLYIDDRSIAFDNEESRERALQMMRSL